MSWLSCWEEERMLAEWNGRQKPVFRTAYNNICTFKISTGINVCMYVSAKPQRSYNRIFLYVASFRLFWLNSCTEAVWSVFGKRRVLVATLTNRWHQHRNVILHRTARWNKVKVPALTSLGQMCNSFPALFLTSPSSHRILFLFIFPTSSDSAYIRPPLGDQFQR